LEDNGLHLRPSDSFERQTRQEHVSYSDPHALTGFILPYSEQRFLWLEQQEREEDILPATVVENYIPEAIAINGPNTNSETSHPIASLTDEGRNFYRKQLSTAIREGRLNDVETQLNRLTEEDRLSIINKPDIAVSPHINMVNQQSLFVDAIAAKNKEAVALLLRHGAEINRVEPLQENRTPLHHAAEKGDAEIIRFLLENGAQSNINTPVGRSLETPLHLAMFRPNSTNIAIALLDAGADPQLGNLKKKTPLHVAVLFQRDPCAAQTILKRLAPADRLRAINVQETERGDSLLHSIIKNAGLSSENGSINTGEDGRMGMLRFLLDNGADTMKTNREGITPLRLLSIQSNNAPEKRQQFIQLAHLLLDHGANPKDLSNKDFKRDVLAGRPKEKGSIQRLFQNLALSRPAIGRDRLGYIR
jgi:ankyrin repeat protein